jgi:Tfp pilus assembly protein PilO
MTWLAVTEFFSKSWEWLKENWKVPLVLIYTVVVWIIARGNTGALKDVLEARKEAHKKEIETLRNNHRHELEQRDRSIEEYQKAMLRVEEEFRKRGEQIEEAHKQRVKEITSANPDKIREKIEKEFGFKYVEMD